MKHIIYKKRIEQLYCVDVILSFQTCFFFFFKYYRKFWFG